MARHRQSIYPDAIHPAVKSNLDKRREPKTKLQAGDRLTKVPPAPKTLNQGARQEWKALTPVLVELGTICKADLRALEMLCGILADESRLQKIVDNEGYLLETGTGGKKANPAVKSLETARNQAERMLANFGLYPKARNYVSRAPEPQGPNSFARFIKR